jgi:hypothetical protein
MLDQQGMKAVAQELRAAVDRVDRIQAESTERLMRSDHADEQRATLAMMFFEDAEEPEGANGGKHKKKQGRGPR